METIEWKLPGKERRFLVELPLKWYGKFKVNTSYHYKLYKTYLRDIQERNVFVQARMSYNNGEVKPLISYQHIIIKHLPDGSIKRNETIVDQQKYSSLLSWSDSAKVSIYKSVHILSFNASIFELDVYRNDIGLTILRTNTNEDNVLLPPYLKISKEITDDIVYDELSIATPRRFSAHR